MYYEQIWINNEPARLYLWIYIENLDLKGCKNIVFVTKLNLSKVLHYISFQVLNTCRVPIVFNVVSDCWSVVYSQLEGVKSKHKKKKLIRKDCKWKAASGNESDVSMVFSY